MNFKGFIKLLYFFLFCSPLLSITVVQSCRRSKRVEYCNCLKNQRSVIVQDLENNVEEAVDYLEILRAYACGLKEINIQRKRHRVDIISTFHQYDLYERFYFFFLNNVLYETNSCIERAFSAQINDISKNILCCLSKNTNIAIHHLDWVKNRNEEKVTECMYNLRSKNLEEVCNDFI